MNKSSRLLALGLLAAPFGLAACSSSSTSAPTTTTGLDPDVAQVMAKAKSAAEAAGLPTAGIKATAKVSPINDSWMHFEVTGTTSSGAMATYYGFAHQAQEWSVAAFGTSSTTGCGTVAPGGATVTMAPLGSSMLPVPASVVASFGIKCS